MAAWVAVWPSQRGLILLGTERIKIALMSAKKDEFVNASLSSCRHT